MRLGSFIVKSLNNTLELLSTLLIAGSTVAGGFYFQSIGANPIFGGIIGLISSILFVIIFFGVAFLFFEINNNLIAIKGYLDKLSNGNEK